MGRQLWLADKLRAAGLHVVEVPGWKTRGSESFSPVGLTWHATAGSRTATAQGEVDVILHGSNTAPPPIAQLMIWRDGTVYVCAAGRCNHNKVGWAGVNKGLGNTSLFGIEMANDNRGEPWPTVQLMAARRASVVIFRELGTDPRKRLAGHYEHQPAKGKPAGETSTKTDPFGVSMPAARDAVYALLHGQEQGEGNAMIKLTPQAKTLLGGDYAKAGEVSEASRDNLLLIFGAEARRDAAAAAGAAAATQKLVKIISDRDEVDEVVLGQQVAAALAPAVTALVVPVLTDLIAEAGAAQLTADQVSEAVEHGVREVLLRGVDDEDESPIPSP